MFNLDNKIRLALTLSTENRRKKALVTILVDLHKEYPDKPPGDVAEMFNLAMGRALNLISLH